MSADVRAQAAEAGDLKDPAKYRALARFGYAARGVVYVIVGALAVTAAIGGGGRTTDTKGAVQTLLAQPLGYVLVALIAIGLVAFSLWRATQAIADADRHGTGAKGLTIRGGLLVSAVTHLLLAVFAASLVLGDGGASGGSSGDGSTQTWTAWLMAKPFGRWLVGLVGVAVIGAGLAQIVKGWTAKFEKRLQVDQSKLRWATPISRFGLLARGFVFLIIGGFIALAAYNYDPQQARGLAGALETLQGQPYGQILLAVVALGLVAFGLYCFIEAAWRRVGIGSNPMHR